MPRLSGRLTNGESLPVGQLWEDAAVMLPADLRSGLFRHAFTGEIIRAAGPDGSRLPASEIFKTCPVALLLADDAESCSPSRRDA